MALFSKKKVEQSKTAPAVTTSSGASSASVPLDISSVLLRPRVTEKATFGAEASVYVFEVSPRASKGDVARAIRGIYKVNPVKVNVVKIPRKKMASRRVRGVFGLSGGGKKAYVHLKKGETIELV